MATVSKNRYFFHQRLFFLLFFVTGILVVAVVFFQYRYEKKTKLEELNENLQIFNSFLLRELEKGIPAEKVLTKKILPYRNVRVSVLRDDGVVIYDNIADTHLLGNHLSKPEVRLACENGESYVAMRTSAYNGQDYFFTAMKGDSFIVRTGIPYTDSLRELLQADMGLVWFVLFIVVLAAGTGIMGTRRLGKIIARLNNFAEKAERGEQMSDKEKEFTNDELGEISRHIVSLYTRLQNTVEERDLEHRKALEHEQEKVRIKRELTNNINHELKTPVAAIQVCAETFLTCENLSVERKRELAERCNSSCERLMHLLEDVSLITRIEEGSLMIQKERICLNDQVENIVYDMEDSLAKAGIVVHLDFKEENVEIEGNSSLLISIFKNLIDNTIAYSNARNIFIGLLENNDRYCRLFYEDDGEGVDPSHLSRLFERFYRVDKGRSRKAGGTGLGLSIVKHAVKFHGGNIFASNGKTGGLRFDMSLMKNGDYRSIPSLESTPSQ